MEKVVILVISIILVAGSETSEVVAHRKTLIRDDGPIHAHSHHHAAHSRRTQNHAIEGHVAGVDPIKMVNDLCATATYKDACIKSLSSFKKDHNPQEFFKSGVNLALDEVTKVSNLPNTLLPKANTKRSTSALKTCKELLQQSIDRLKMASNQVDAADLHTTLKDPSAVLNLRLELGDVNTFSSSCLDEFGEAQDPKLQQLMQDGITEAKELAVNMLDVVSTYQF